MQREMIIHNAATYFAGYGIKGVGMDDIAAVLHISKKTLYELFHSKSELLHDCVNFMIHENKETILKGNREIDSSLHAIVWINSSTLSQFLSLCPSFYREMKLYPQSQKLIEDYYSLFIRAEYLKYFSQGIEKGIFRAEHNYQYTLQFFEEQIRSVFKGPATLLSRNMESYGQTILTYLAGICTDNGRKELSNIPFDQFYF